MSIIIGCPVTAHMILINSASLFFSLHIKTSASFMHLALLYNRKRENSILHTVLYVGYVCGMSHVWNINYLTTISECAIVYKYHRTNIRELLAFQECDLPQTYNVFYMRRWMLSSLLLLMHSSTDKSIKTLMGQAAVQLR